MADKENKNTIEVSLNFLGTPITVEDKEKILSSGNPTSKIDRCVFQHIVGFPPDAVSAECLENYFEVSTPDLYLSFLPAHPKITAKLIMPLKSAKRCFCLGEFLASIELSAHVGEMLSSLIWEISDFRMNGAPIDDNAQNLLFGRVFEKMSQADRVKLLLGIKAISEVECEKFDRLRQLRTAYFHKWSTEAENLKSDAKQSYKIAIELLKEVTQMEFVEGRVKLRPDLMRFLQN